MAHRSPIASTLNRGPLPNDNSLKNLFNFQLSSKHHFAMPNWPPTQSAPLSSARHDHPQRTMTDNERREGRVFPSPIWPVLLPIGLSMFPCLAMLPCLAMFPFLAMFPSRRPILSPVTLSPLWPAALPRLLCFGCSAWAALGAVHQRPRF